MVISKQLGDTKNDLLNAYSLGSTQRDILIELDDIFDECNEDNWDGYNAKAISLETLETAERFAECFMLMEVPVPDIISEPDGSIAFEWEKSPYHSLLVSINQFGEIAYIGMFGYNRAKGIERFADTIPLNIVSNLKRLYQ